MHVIGLFVILLNVKISEALGSRARFSLPISNKTVLVGEDVSLECLVDNPAHFKVAWIRQKDLTLLSVGQLLVANKKKFDIERTLSDSWNLKIRHASMDDGGWYTCQLNTLPVRSQSGYVHVHEPPTILSEQWYSNEVDVNVGGMVTMSCIARGHPKPTISWSRQDGHLIRLDHNRVVTRVHGEHLVLFNVTKENAAIYQCTANNSVPPAKVRQIIVRVHSASPKLTVSNAEISTRVGHDVSLTCWITTYSLVKAWWTKNDAADCKTCKLKSNLRHSIMLTSAGPSKKELHLIIRKVSDTDYGNYTCHANSTSGYAHRTILVMQATDEIDVSANHTTLLGNMTNNIGNETDSMGNTTAETLDVTLDTFRSSAVLSKGASQLRIQIIGSFKYLALSLNFLFFQNL